MEPKALLTAARKGDFWSYAAGVAYKLLTDYRISGAVINNYKTDLPLKKGLSSSAAICVLTARALSRLYDLKMTVRGEMEYAYQGELLTPSKCGRMDQACAFGSRPVSMSYDGEFVDVKEIRVPRPLYYCVVDLKAKKDTTIILRELQRGYPTPQTDEQKDVAAVLGELNLSITDRAARAFEKGDAEELGLLMKEAQSNFDRAGQKVCPQQLTAPVLHKVLNYTGIEPYIWGGKGVGAGGDGTAQFLCRDEHAQSQVKMILEQDLKVDVMLLTIEASSKVRKAVLPAAGFGADLFPATKCVCPPLFPVVDKDGIAKPAILLTVQELVEAGIEEIIIIVQQMDLSVYENLFIKPIPKENFERLSPQNKILAKEILQIGERVKFVVQEKQDGFGNAVLCAKNLVGSDHFLLVLGDHIYRTLDKTRRSCVQQMLDTYKTECGDGSALVALQRTPPENISDFGAATGTWIANADGSMSTDIMKLSTIIEKPTMEDAETLLKVPEERHTFLSFFGHYVLPSSIFKLLQDQQDSNLRMKNGQFGFTDVLSRFKDNVGAKGLIMKGLRYDIGTPEHFLHTNQTFLNELDPRKNPIKY
eukprot:Stramenopile-MAST_4_protein_615